MLTRLLSILVVLVLNSSGLTFAQVTATFWIPERVDTHNNPQGSVISVGNGLTTVAVQGDSSNGANTFTIGATFFGIVQTGNGFSYGCTAATPVTGSNAQPVCTIMISGSACTYSNEGQNSVQPKQTQTSSATETSVSEYAPGGFGSRQRKRELATEVNRLILFEHERRDVTATTSTATSNANANDDNGNYCYEGITSFGSGGIGIQTYTESSVNFHTLTITAGEDKISSTGSTTAGLSIVSLTSPTGSTTVATTEMSTLTISASTTGTSSGNSLICKPVVSFISTFATTLCILMFV